MILEDFRERMRNIDADLERIKSELESILHDFIPYADNVRTNIEAAIDDAVGFSQRFRHGYNYVVGEDILPDDSTILKQAVSGEYRSGDILDILDDAQEKIESTIDDYESWRKAKADELQSSLKIVFEDFKKMTAPESENNDRQQANKYAQEIRNELNGKSS